MNEPNYQDIWSLIRLRRYSLANSQIATAFTQNPNDPELFYLAAYVCWQTSEISRGLELTERGLALSPDSTSLQYIRFLLHEEAENYADAEQIIIELIRRHPRDADYLSSYSRIMLYSFHIKKARLLCNEALRVSPDNNEAHVIDLLLSVAEGKLKNAQEKIKNLLSESPESERNIRLLILVLSNNNQHKPALLLAQELIRKNPNDTQLIELAVQLRQFTHWSAIPLWPMYRFGVRASVAIWLGMLVLLQVTKHYQFWWMNSFTGVYIGWVIYSWVHAPILRRWLQYRGL